MAAGSEVQSQRAERLKALFPMGIRRAEGTVRRVADEDQREPEALAK